MTNDLHARTTRRCAAWALAAGLALTTACAADRAPAGDARAASPVQALIGDAACTADADCHSIGIGARACGGPDSYLAWSSARTDGDALQRAASAQAAQRRREIAARGEMSTCQALVDPGAYCAAANASAPRRLCALRPSPAAGVR